MTGSATPDELRTWDLLVVGGGVAGLAAAIAAADAGRSVLLVERSDELGGLCAWSGGNLLRLGADSGLAHLRALSLDKTDDTVLAAYAEGLVDLEAWLVSLGARLKEQPVSGPGAVAPCWPNTPGGDEVRYYRVAGTEPAGRALLALLVRALAERAVEVRLGTRLVDLDLDESEAVRGACLEDAEGSVRVATRSVLLATGGFESSPELRDAYLPVSPSWSLVADANTGDGLRLAQRAGAAVWHMSNYFGFWCTRTPDQAAPYAIRFRDPGHLIVDAAGHRFAAETGRESHDVLRSVEAALPHQPHVPGFPVLGIVDAAALAAGPLSAMPTRNLHRWSPDNAAEVAAGWVLGGGSVAELAASTGADAQHLAASLDRFNDLARRGNDVDFGRAPQSMRPLDLDRLYAVRLWPGVATTTGGPRRDAAARVVDWSGRPVPGLFAAGGNGSVWGHLTEHGGGLTDGLVFGRIAAGG